MRAEIFEQPDIYQRILSGNRAQIEGVAAVIRARRPRFVLFLARGSSDHAALYAKYLVETRLLLPAGLASPSSRTVYAAMPELDGVLVISISQSGSSPDVVLPTADARRAGAITLAVTNDCRSDLALAAELVLDISAGPENGVAATKTYSAELLTMLLLIEALGGRSPAESYTLPEQASALLELEPAVMGFVRGYELSPSLLLTSRGYEYPTVRETALKIIETVGIAAMAFSGADLLHGPMAMVHEDFPVILVIPPLDAGEAMEPVVTALTARRANVMTIRIGARHKATETELELPFFGPPYLSPLLTILPLQLFALHLALLRGKNPDCPLGLTKVTRTR